MSQEFRSSINPVVTWLPQSGYVPDENPIQVSKQGTGRSSIFVCR
ncbi:hypothetical protein [Brevibacillus porteri]